SSDVCSSDLASGTTASDATALSGQASDLEVFSKVVYGEEGGVCILRVSQNPPRRGAKQNAHMDKANVVRFETQASAVAQGRVDLEQLLRQGAQRMLQTAIEKEVEQFVAAHASCRTADDRQAVVRNGSLPARKIVTGLGPIEVRQPRVRDRRTEDRITFSSAILPKYLRRVPSVDALIPALYLHGISTGDFTEALESILGPNATGLSAANIVRLKEVWEAEYLQWSRRDLSG